MGTSNCGCLFCNCKKNIEFQNQLNFPSTNLKYEIIEEREDNNFKISLKNKPNKINKSSSSSLLNSKLSEKIIDTKNNQNIKFLIKNINIKDIYFPIDENKLGEESARIFEKVEKFLSKFYPCDEKYLNQIETYLINLIIKSKNNLIKNIKQNKIIFNAKLQKMINLNYTKYDTRKYSERFCVLYKDEIKYYRSEIQFLKDLKPLNIIYLDQIARINIAKNDKNSKKINTLIICNKYPLEKEKAVYQNFGNDINDNIYMNHSNESIIIFKSDDEKIILKVFGFIEFLISYHKNEEK